MHNLINLINNFANNCPALREIINQPFPTFQRQSLLERIFFSLHRHYEIFIWHLCFETDFQNWPFQFLVLYKTEWRILKSWLCLLWHLVNVNSLISHKDNILIVQRSENLGKLQIHLNEFKKNHQHLPTKNCLGNCE